MGQILSIFLKALLVFANNNRLYFIVGFVWPTSECFAYS